MDIFLIISCAEFPASSNHADDCNICDLSGDRIMSSLLIQLGAWIAPRGHHASIFAVTASVPD